MNGFSNSPRQGLGTVGYILDSTILPDPTVPVAINRFAPLGQSDDLLTRAAFWCFYSALLEEQKGPYSVPATCVQARNDGHTLQAVTQELSIRDAVLIQKHDLEELERGYAQYMLKRELAVTYTALIWAIMCTLLIGLTVGVLLHDFLQAA